MEIHRTQGQLYLIDITIRAEAQEHLTTGHVAPQVDSNLVTAVERLLPRLLFQTPVGGITQEYLIPVIDDVVREIDVESKKIIITPLKGLLDDED